MCTYATCHTWQLFGGDATLKVGQKVGLGNKQFLSLRLSWGVLGDVHLPPRQRTFATSMTHLMQIWMVLN